MPYLVSVPDFDQHSPSYKWEKKFNPSQLEAAFSETGGLENIKILKKSNTGRIVLARVVGPLGDHENYPKASTFV